jgi:hypothetical protein
MKSIRITPLSVILVVALAGSSAVFAFGPSAAQQPALIVLIILALGLAGAAVPFGGLRGGGRASMSLAERRREFHPTDRRDDPAPPLTAQAEAELWSKERERYEQRDG